MIVAVGCAAAFSLGLYAVLTRRDLIAILAGAELMLGAANVHLVALVLANGGDAARVSVFALVILVIAAAEAAVGMAIAVTAYRATKRTYIDEFGEVSG
ncbi:MAG: NADH-quinone oxidoreductase subunit NuoK [Aeromicrobium sp.]|jgi:NADH-quinone oxidoreductase subunit K|nr:NADH-quinone oxidoreductase subunit NuoK [Aeromicrobium sp.]